MKLSYIGLPQALSILKPLLWSLLVSSWYLTFLPRGPQLDEIEVDRGIRGNGGCCILRGRRQSSSALDCGTTPSRFETDSVVGFHGPLHHHMTLGNSCSCTKSYDVYSYSHGGGGPTNSPEASFSWTSTYDHLYGSSLRSKIGPRVRTGFTDAFTDERTGPERALRTENAVIFNRRFWSPLPRQRKQMKRVVDSRAPKIVWKLYLLPICNSPWWHTFLKMKPTDEYKASLSNATAFKHGYPEGRSTTAAWIYNINDNTVRAILHREQQHGEAAVKHGGHNKILLEVQVEAILWWVPVVRYKNHMIEACTRVFMYLASS